MFTDNLFIIFSTFTVADLSAHRVAVDRVSEHRPGDLPRSLGILGSHRGAEVNDRGQSRVLVAFHAMPCDLVYFVDFFLQFYDCNARHVSTVFVWSFNIQFSDSLNFVLSEEPLKLLDNQHFGPKTFF
jgi:hypothetical protein